MIFWTYSMLKPCKSFSTSPFYTNKTLACLITLQTIDLRFLPSFIYVSMLRTLSCSVYSVLLYMVQDYLRHKISAHEIGNLINGTCLQLDVNIIFLQYSICKNRLLSIHSIVITFLSFMVCDYRVSKK